MYDIVLNHRKSTSSEKEVESPSAESNADAIGATHVELDDRNMQGQAALAGSPPQSNTANQAPERISEIGCFIIAFLRIPIIKGKGSKALLAFSLYTNIPKILSTKLPPNSYTCMYGIRFWSMMWIILGHAWQLGLTILPGPGNSVADNVGDSVKQESEQWTRAAIRNMSIAVESFFLLSGALVTMGFMKQMQRQSDKVTCRQVSIFYFHRYWRLTPVLAIVSIFTAGLFNFLVDGPMVKGTFAEGHLCRTRWWSTIFYINNLIPPYTTCLGWTWYLACDFQFYVVAPVFIILLYKYKWVGLAITIGATSLSVAIITALVALVLKGLMDYYTGFYIRPWSRFFSFGVGILLGYTMFKTKCQTKLPRWALILGWTLALFACLLAVYGDLGQGDCSWCRPHPLATRVLFLGTQRVLFALGVAWVVYVSCCGQGGFVNTFLSWKAFVPLGKLTYTCYLIHPLVIYYFEYSRSTQIHILGSTMTLFYSGYVLISYSIALFVSAAFELPMISLEKIFLPRH
ncbi:hypothetical protein CAPTEDRAFT_212209 [Capitella teleta]|uniref:Acyltransferase 3 domain-containing protein n=1 Tax=Capitella teleta TaxID=283909 RepID=R7T7W7_CAPTE|nr:hypothetical protein CAPTEDRAFT_212209 [Capitella teleta]|eukprot:ELT87089.1 hypothetical protein CAPTEDRAFT_212209 [Capitella teleta]